MKIRIICALLSLLMLMCAFSSCKFFKRPPGQIEEYDEFYSDDPMSWITLDGHGLFEEDITWGPNYITFKNPGSLVEALQLVKSHPEVLPDGVREDCIEPILSHRKVYIPKDLPEGFVLNYAQLAYYRFYHSENVGYYITYNYTFKTTFYLHIDYGPDSNPDLCPSYYKDGIPLEFSLNLVFGTPPIFYLEYNSLEDVLTGDSYQHTDEYIYWAPDPFNSDAYFNYFIYYNIEDEFGKIKLQLKSLNKEIGIPLDELDGDLECFATADSVYRLFSSYDVVDLNDLPPLELPTKPGNTVLTWKDFYDVEKTHKPTDAEILQLEPNISFQEAVKLVGRPHSPGPTSGFHTVLWETVEGHTYMMYLLLSEDHPEDMEETFENLLLYGVLCLEPIDITDAYTWTT